MKKFMWLVSVWVAGQFVQPAWAGLEEGAAAFARGDYGTALRELQPLAEQGDATAQARIGVLYLRGLGVTRNYATAKGWLDKSAVQGNADALYNLGTIFESGQGVLRDRASAFRLYQAAAKKGQSDAQFSLGQIYSNGQGVPRNLRAAIQWYRKAAAQGNENAKYNLKLLGQPTVTVVESRKEKQKPRSLSHPQHVR